MLKNTMYTPITLKSTAISKISSHWEIYYSWDGLVWKSDSKNFITFWDILQHTLKFTILFRANKLILPPSWILMNNVIAKLMEDFFCTMYKSINIILVSSESVNKQKIVFFTAFWKQNCGFILYKIYDITAQNFATQCENIPLSSGCRQTCWVFHGNSSFEMSPIEWFANKVCLSPLWLWSFLQHGWTNFHQVRHKGIFWPSVEG